MRSTQSMRRKKNLLLAFDAFGTLFYPKQPIPKQYGYFAEKYGIEHANSQHGIKDSFKVAFKDESKKNLNYGKAIGLGAEKWWANVISKTFDPFLKPGQHVPQEMISDLLTRFSTKEGYNLYPDVLPFFSLLRNIRQQSADINSTSTRWPWDKTIVGIITNSDDRVPGILSSFGLKIGPRRVGTTGQRSKEASANDDISFVVLSYDVGVEKPDRGMFDAATEMLRETLAEASDGVQSQPAEEFEKLYVGDSIEKDYLGATAAGWDAIFLDRRDGNTERENSSVVRTRIKVKNGGGREVEKEVDAVQDLRALTKWRPKGS